jgi:hypothetical protein
MVYLKVIKYYVGTVIVDVRKIKEFVHINCHPYRGRRMYENVVYRVQL